MGNDGAKVFDRNNDLQVFFGVVYVKVVGIDSYCCFERLLEDLFGWI